MVLDCKGFAGFAGFYLVTGDSLEPAVSLGADFAVFPLLLLVTSCRIGFSVTGPGVVWGSAGE